MSATEGTAKTWDEARLLEFISDRIEESITVEYKAAPAIGRESKRVFDITRDVSAMANSAGGVVIYGIAQHKDATREHLPERIDPIARSNFSKEWLEHIINQIRPRLTGVKVHSIQLSSASDHIAYVVEVPQGTTAYQANDCRYYRRYNFEAIPMIDHEVRDVMNRKGHPRLSVTVRFVIYNTPNKDARHGALCVEILNTSDVFARYVALAIYSPMQVATKWPCYDGAIVDKSEGYDCYRLTFSNHQGSPLFPRAALTPRFPFRFADFLSPKPANDLGHFKWCVFADSMPKEEGRFNPSDIIEKMGTKQILLR